MPWEENVMKLAVAAFLMVVLPAGGVSAKVCFSCKDRKPVAYVCADKDTFTARRNARKLGCKITSYSSSCSCGATVDSKAVLRGAPLPVGVHLWRHLIARHGFGN